MSKTPRDKLFGKMYTKLKTSYYSYKLGGWRSVSGPLGFSAFYYYHKYKIKVLKLLRNLKMVRLLFAGIVATILIIMLSRTRAVKDEIPTVYEYFTDNGNVGSGLTADSPGFFRLNGKDLRILSGALHYFRVHPEQWRDRLRKLRASGCNTVETYVPWNLHEPQPDVYDFGTGTDQFSTFLDVRKFVQMAKEEDLLVLFRPGPYICSEWDFGGFPSWLQKDPNMAVRTDYPPYLERVKKYFDKLLPLVSDLTFIKGGPIIGAQIENEYGSFDKIHKSYLEFVKTLYEQNGLDCLYYTSDGTYNGVKGALPEAGVLMTANFQTDPDTSLNQLMELQPNKPNMVMEFWAGWFDHWFEQHHNLSTELFASVLETIFDKYNGSVNLYMFFGGTSFGFMAGANARKTPPFYEPDITSYDYDAPLSEAGDYTEKYHKLVELIQKYQVPALRRPELPVQSVKVVYPEIIPDKYLPFQSVLAQVPSNSIFNHPDVISMEMLPMNNDAGQSYGYILYRAKVQFSGLVGALNVTSSVKDFGIVLLDGEIVPLGQSKYWINSNLTLELTVDDPGEHTLDILVQNMGRVNYGYAADLLQQKGLTDGAVYFDNTKLGDFTVYALEFKSSWIKSLTNWLPMKKEASAAPGIFQSTFIIEDNLISDTFIQMSGWHKGIVFLNDFNLGRYFKVGPQQTLYAPAPLLKSGGNTITIFEELEPGPSIKFSNKPIWETIKKPKKYTNVIF